MEPKNLSFCKHFLVSLIALGLLINIKYIRDSATGHLTVGTYLPDIHYVYEPKSN